MAEIYEGHGMSQEEALEVVKILSKNKEHFVDVMMVEELGLMPPDPEENVARIGAFGPSHHLMQLLTPP